MATTLADSVPSILWEHPDKESTHMWKFKTALEQSTGRIFHDYEEMYQYSCQNRSEFWLSIFGYMPVICSGIVPSVCVDESAPISSVPRWFEGVNMNFAENILFVGDDQGKATVSPGKEDDKIAITEVREGSFLEPVRHLTWRELRTRVGRLSNAMRAHGVRKGDRIAIVASTCIDTLTVFLATTAIGALFSSSSTDMGTKGILDRLIQIKPKYLFMDDFAVYNGKNIDLRPKMEAIVDGMLGVSEFEGVVSQCRFIGQPGDVSNIFRAQSWDSFLTASTSSRLVFEQTSFSDPFLIVYSSGTTGTPKCIVHAHGGVILNGHKDCKLYNDLDHTSTQLQYTTTGWIMYTASVQALLVGAHMVTYDGSPFLPDPTAFIRLVGELGVTHLGISPRYLSTLQTANIVPKKVANLIKLKVVTSTGMVLPEAQFQWFYDVGFPKEVHLNNISGGTDLIGLFGTGNPIVPIYSGGGCQTRSMGYAVEVYDSTIESPDANGNPPVGVPVEDGVPGELVCTAAFPTMPVMFYGEDGPQKYFNSYFARFKDVWTHGDFIQIHPVTKGVLFLGRADGVLNPSGVRFGSAEIYNVIDKWFGHIVQDSICVGQRRPQDQDERVVLFLLMKQGKKYNRELIKEVKQRIGQELSKRHVPKFVFETKEIPTTVNLKKVELPVKQIISGKNVKPSGTLLNPDCLEFYYQFAHDEYLHEIEARDQLLHAKL